MTVDTIEGRMSASPGDRLTSDPATQPSTADEAGRHEGPPLVRVSGLKVATASRRAGPLLVTSADLVIRSGEVHGLVGETGSGKSLVARSIAGLVPAGLQVVGGSIDFDGLDLVAASPAQLRSVHGAGIAYIPQNPFSALEPVMKIERQFRAVARAHTRWGRAEVRERAVQRLADVGLRDPERILAGYAHELSGGMAQRVVIALSTLFAPKLVVADEPTTGLDPTVQKRVLESLVAACREAGSSLLLISHDLGIVSRFADRIDVMYAGRMVETGPGAVVFSDPLHPYTWGLLASLPRDGRPGAVMAGGLPDPSERGGGCEFSARCPHATSGCTEQEPSLIEILDDRRVACHLYRDAVPQA